MKADVRAVDFVFFSCVLKTTLHDASMSLERDTVGP